MAVTAQRFVRRNRKGRVLTVAREHFDAFLAAGVPSGGLPALPYEDSRRDR